MVGVGSAFVGWLLFGGKGVNSNGHSSELYVLARLPLSSSPTLQAGLYGCGARMPESSESRVVRQSDMFE